ncbi:hypothetical protein CXT76_01795 [Candidatus Parvarchaeota archaeon]|jgi:hypothetical protein|nr:MAG: hypothetical protein CXT76_01795 [Candidatus Parvarchaeota archaeon]HIG52119.1 hypothetical protein [Candidatus Pacearchaeota archaeon]
MQKIELKENSGFMEFGRIPHHIYYETNSESFEDLSEKSPAIYKLTPNLLSLSENKNVSQEKDYSLSIWIHESVPRNYVDNIMFHELVEAELVLVDKLDQKSAHKLAVKFEEKYIKKFYGLEKLTELYIWRRENINNY